MDLLSKHNIRKLLQVLVLYWWFEFRRFTKLFDYYISFLLKSTAEANGFVLVMFGFLIKLRKNYRAGALAPCIQSILEQNFALNKESNKRKSKKWIKDYNTKRQDKNINVIEKYRQKSCGAVYVCDRLSNLRLELKSSTWRNMTENWRWKKLGNRKPKNLKFQNPD